MGIQFFTCHFMSVWPHAVTGADRQVLELVPVSLEALIGLT